MKCIVRESIINGSVYISPSKSETMRAIVFAAMAKGVSKISNILQSPDTYAMIEGIKSFGAKVNEHGNYIEILGVGGKLVSPKQMIDVGNSGLALRFLSAMAALVEGEVLITGDESIRNRRPIIPLLDIYKKSGMIVSTFNDNGTFISIKGKMTPGTIVVDGSDSQIISSLLFTAAFLDGDTEIFVLNPGEKPWVGLTIDWLDFIGVKVYNDSYRFYEIEGRAKYKGFCSTIGGDYSTALFTIAAAIITKGSIRIYGLKEESKQADKLVLDIFRKMGARISFDRGRLEVSYVSSIIGVDVNINDCIDALPILSVVATFASSKTVISGAEIARLKESNRIKEMSIQLKNMGAVIEEKHDGMIIYPSTLYGAILEGKNDHRVILSLIVAASRAKGVSTINGVEAMVKSYPTGIYDFICCGMNLNLII